MEKVAGIEKEKRKLPKSNGKGTLSVQLLRMSDDATGQTSNKGEPSAQAPIVDEDEIDAAGSSNLPEQQSTAEHNDEQRQYHENSPRTIESPQPYMDVLTESDPN